MTKVLVASASKHGATEEIARSDRRGPARRTDSTVDVKRMEDVDTVFPYDAFVLGSAVYMGSWLRSAHAASSTSMPSCIATRPTWLFSSGPIGDAPHAAAERLVRRRAISSTATHARDHQLFGGKLDKEHLGAGRARCWPGLLRVPEGDYRQWDAIIAWATAIARSLTADLLV